MKMSAFNHYSKGRLSATIIRKNWNIRLLVSENVKISECLRRLPQYAECKPTLLREEVGIRRSVRCQQYHSYQSSTNKDPPEFKEFFLKQLTENVFTALSTGIGFVWNLQTSDSLVNFFLEAEDPTMKTIWRRSPQLKPLPLHLDRLSSKERLLVPNSISACCIIWCCPCTHLLRIRTWMSSSSVPWFLSLK